MDEIRSLAVLFAKVAPKQFLVDKIRDELQNVENAGGIDNAPKDIVQGLAVACIMLATKIGTADRDAKTVIKDLDDLSSLRDQMKKVTSQ